MLSNMETNSGGAFEFGGGAIESDLSMSNNAKAKARYIRPKSGVVQNRNPVIRYRNR